MAGHVRRLLSKSVPILSQQAQRHPFELKWLNNLRSVSMKWHIPLTEACFKRMFFFIDEH